MKRTILAACILVVISVFVFAQTQQESGSGIQRYQLIPATVTSLGKLGGPVEVKRPFLLDSETGAIWQYQRMAVIGDEKKNDPEVMVPAHFVRLGVNGLQGWSEELMLKQLFETQQKIRERRDRRKRP